MKVRSAVTPSALVFSLLTHAVLTGLFLNSLTKLSAGEEEAAAMFAELVEPSPPAPVKERQIAPPSAAKETDRPPPEARPGASNMATEKETLRRGVSPEQPPPSPPAPKPEPRPPARPQPAKEAASNRQPVSPKKGDPVLRLGENELLARLSEGTAEPNGGKELAAPPAPDSKATRQTERQREMKLRAAEPFRKSFSLSPLQTGVPDVLQSVPDGEITLLNEKADVFAVFVRRVALQVFGSLRRSSWTSLPYPEVYGLQKFARIRAVISPQGKFIRAELLDGSGSFRFDDLFRSSVEHGANDQNPPKEALAPDGNFRFIFLARTWARHSPSGPEQRWLVLGTGLE